jgi:hypothetical protein
MQPSTSLVIQSDLFLEGLDMKRLAIMMSTGLAISLLAGCGSDVATPTSGSATLPSRGAPPLGTVNLNVTVSDVNSIGVAYNIQSDGGGTYFNGQKNVSAQLTTSGTLDFELDTAVGTKYAEPLRWLVANYNQPLNASNTYRPTPNANPIWRMVTTGGTVALQNLGVSGNPASQCIGLGGSFRDAKNSWRYTFEKDPTVSDSAGTAYVMVTRTSVSPAVWTLTPVGCANDNVSGLSVAPETPKLGAYTFEGDYSLPFFITLQAQ